MKVLLTGGSGFLGSHVAEQLVARGDTVRCLVRRSSNKRFLESLGPSVEFVYGAVDDAASLTEAAAGVDAVVHSAGLVKARDDDEYFRVNADGARTLLEAVAPHAKQLQRFVYVGTAAVMGPCASGQTHQRDDAPKPSTGYARSKLAGEEFVRGYVERMPITILRPVAVYGPRDTENLPIYQAAKTGVALRLGLQEGCSWVYGPECAACVVRALDVDVPSGSTYFVADRKPMTIDEIADAAASAVGTGVGLRVNVPRWLLGAAAKGADAYARATRKAVKFSTDFLPELTMRRFVVDARATYEELGWDPKVEFPEGAQRTAAWYREQGLL